jgi:DNA-binding XRE family transcriptional regulator
MFGKEVSAMTLGQKLKKLRTEKGLTQKDLADQLHVTFQTVSKWESDTNEPDFSTLKELSKLLDCSIEYLFSDDELSVEIEDSTPEVEEVSVVPVRTKIGVCRDCGKELFDDDLVHTVERKSAGGTKEMVTVCDECFKKHEDEINRRAKEIEDSMKPAPKKVGTGPFHKITDRNDSKPLIWSIIIGAIALIVTLIVCIVNSSSVGIGWTIGAPILIGYFFLSTIYCIFTASFVSDVFMTVAGWSIRFPGLIFTWDLEGFMWLIAMKILFFVLGVMFGVFVFLLALSLSAFLSFFSFIPLLIYNKTHY